MKGSQPVLFISAKTPPEAFTKTLKAVWENGCDIATEYDRSGDPPSKDATVLAEIEGPLPLSLGISTHRHIPMVPYPRATSCPSCIYVRRQKPLRPSPVLQRKESSGQIGMSLA